MSFNGEITRLAGRLKSDFRKIILNTQSPWNTPGTKSRKF